MRAEETVGLARGSLVKATRRAAIVMATVALCGLVTSCGQDGTGNAAGGGSAGGGSQRNIEGGIRSPVTVGDAVITVNSLQAAFQPVAPAQRLSDEALVAPAAGVTFYQAYVRVENRGVFPLRVDAEDFVCRIGNTLSMLEPTRSGPVARSLIFGTSLDLVLTFRGAAGAEPILMYSPSWYSGIISFSANAQSQGTTTTGLTQTQPTIGTDTTTQ